MPSKIVASPRVLKRPIRLIGARAHLFPKKYMVDPDDTPPKNPMEGLLKSYKSITSDLKHLRRVHDSIKSAVNDNSPYPLEEGEHAIREMFVATAMKKELVDSYKKIPHLDHISKIHSELQEVLDFLGQDEFPIPPDELASILEESKATYIQEATARLDRSAINYETWEKNLWEFRQKANEHNFAFPYSDQEISARKALAKATTIEASANIIRQATNLATFNSEVAKLSLNCEELDQPSPIDTTMIHAKRQLFYASILNNITRNLRDNTDDIVQFDRDFTELERTCKLLKTENPITPDDRRARRFAIRYTCLQQKTHSLTENFLSLYDLQVTLSEIRKIAGELGLEGPLNPGLLDAAHQKSLEGIVADIRAETKDAGKLYSKIIKILPKAEEYLNKGEAAIPQEEVQALKALVPLITISNKAEGIRLKEGDITGFVEEMKQLHKLSEQFGYRCPIDQYEERLLEIRIATEKCRQLQSGIEKGADPVVVDTLKKMRQDIIDRHNLEIE